jgi:hypothetical protein
MMGRSGAMMVEAIRAVMWRTDAAILSIVVIGLRRGHQPAQNGQRAAMW